MEKFRHFVPEFHGYNVLELCENTRDQMLLKKGYWEIL